MDHTINVKGGEDIGSEQGMGRSFDTLTLCIHDVLVLTCCLLAVDNGSIRDLCSTEKGYHVVSKPNSK